MGKCRKRNADVRMLHKVEYRIVFDRGDPVDRPNRAARASRRLAPTKTFFRQAAKGNQNPLLDHSFCDSRQQMPLSS